MARAYSLIVSFFIVGFAYPAVAGATKPCPPSPCAGDPIVTEILDLKKCTKIADWVAVGRISGVVHDKKPPPLFKDFAKFVLSVAAFEKGRLPKRIKLRVGWCKSGQQLPENTRGTFRFWGTKPDEDGKVEYLHFERVEGAK